MSHGLTFDKWIDASTAEKKYKKLNKQCLRVYRDYLFKVVEAEHVFDRARRYFAGLDKPLLESFDTPKEVLEVLHSLKNDLKNLNLIDGAMLTYFPGKMHKTERITNEDWINERATALCQYARYLCGIDSSEAVQADHIREVYSLEITRARLAGEAYTVREDHENLVILENKQGYIQECLTNEKAVAKFEIKNVESKKKKTVLHFSDA